VQGSRRGASLKAALTWLFRVEVVLSCGGLLLVATALISDVLAREIFGQGIFGAQKVAVYADAIAGLLAFAVVVHAGGHLRISAVDPLFPKSWHPHIARLGDFISCGLCVLLGFFAARYVLSTMRLGEKDLLFYAKLWPMQMVLPYIFFSAAIRYLSFAAFPALRPAQSGTY
jgi:TRAP-type C4-dicarboxylate transport system permease small subunit